MGAGSTPDRPGRQEAGGGRETLVGKDCGGASSICSRPRESGPGPADSGRGQEGKETNMSHKSRFKEIPQPSLADRTLVVGGLIAIGGGMLILISLMVLGLIRNGL